jgi:hypothetical protein
VKSAPGEKEFCTSTVCEAAPVQDRRSAPPTHDELASKAASMIVTHCEFAQGRFRAPKEPRWFGGGTGVSCLADEAGDARSGSASNEHQPPISRIENPVSTTPSFLPGRGAGPSRLRLVTSRQIQRHFCDGAAPRTRHHFHDETTGWRWRKASMARSLGTAQRAHPPNKRATRPVDQSAGRLGEGGWSILGVSS